MLLRDVINPGIQKAGAAIINNNTGYLEARVRIDLTQVEADTQGGQSLQVIAKFPGAGDAWQSASMESTRVTTDSRGHRLLDLYVAVPTSKDQRKHMKELADRGEGGVAFDVVTEGGTDHAQRFRENLPIYRGVFVALAP